MNILFTICGRAGSKGIKNKNIKKFLDIPLSIYTLSAIDLYLKRNSETKGSVALNTDSIELADLMCKNPWRHVEWIKRNDELAGDKVSKVAVIRNTWNEMQKCTKEKFDMVVDLDITSPLRTIQDIENLISEQKRTGCDVVYSVTDARRNPYFNMVKKSEKGYIRVISSDYVTRQDSPNIYDMNASLYAYSPEFLGSDKEIFQGYCEIIKMMDTAVLDLDHENDFELMEVIAKYLFNKYNAFSEVKEHCDEYK